MRNHPSHNLLFDSLPPNNAMCWPSLPPTKVDRCYDWKPHADTPIRATLAEQEEHTISEFMTRVDGIKLEFAEQVS